ncbi:unnamed protein product [Durusdinium trenchii]|uniref:Uncharacterized protein n=1 Tax=Durusdinium trenchii TaxID=1381693 RepID=A0ABP0ME30_9DINO
MVVFCFLRTRFWPGPTASLNSRDRSFCPKSATDSCSLLLAPSVWLACEAPSAQPRASRLVMDRSEADDASEVEERKTDPAEIIRAETDWINDIEDEMGSDVAEKNKALEVFNESHAFGESMGLLQLSQPEIVVLRKSFELLTAALGTDKEMVGDAIYGVLLGALVAIKDKFSTPRSVMSMRMYNSFRWMVDKCDDQELLKSYVEGLAFKHLGIDVTEARVDSFKDAFSELLQQNVPEAPPGSVAAWRQLLSYTGSSYSFVSASYGERLRVIHEDWNSVQTNAEDEDETVVRSFPKMCAFSNEVMGQETEAWMEELLQVFEVLVEKISSPSLLQEECELLAISMITKSKDIDFERFKPVMMAALRSLLPKTWSTAHETAWEWLWATISQNLQEATMKARAFKPYNAHLFSVLGEEQLEHFRNTIYVDFFSKCAASQDLFKQSQTRLRYIADRVLQSSYDMFHKPKDEMVDDLSALGLRHVGYGVPIELFGPFTDSCVEVMKPLIEALPTGESSKMILCPADRAHELPECELSKHLTLEGFRWSIGLVSRVLVRTIIEGSTAVMQAIHQDDSKRLRRALREAPRSERFTWQLSIRVGSQSISPLYWALRSGAHSVAKTVIQDVLTIRADRDRYYYGVNDLFRLQPDVVENILREAPHLAEILLDGLIWRSHKTQDGWRPVIYYLEHMLQDMDENKMISRALKSLVRFNHPKTIMHPILTFTLDLLWDKLAMRFFVSDRILTLINFLIFLLSGCYLNQLEMEDARASAVILACARICMIVFEPMIRCLGSEEVIAFKCTDLTGDILFAYEVFVIVGIFIYTILVLEVGSISIKLSEYRVLCLHAIEQVVLCVGAVFIAVCTFSFAMAAATHEVGQLSAHEWSNMGSTMGTLVQMCAGVMDLQVLHSLGDESPFLLILVVVFMLLVYSFLFNLLVSQFCGVYSSLAADIKGYARLARGKIILDTLKDIQPKRWKGFIGALALDRRVDFEEGDLGLAGGIKTMEAALEHPVPKEQILRFGGRPDPSLPWPEKKGHEDESGVALWQL